MSKFIPGRFKRLFVWLFCSLSTIALVTTAIAERATTTDRAFIEMQTSVNAIMVAVVDWSAHEVWEAGYAETMTGRNWLSAKQYATHYWRPELWCHLAAPVGQTRIGDQCGVAKMVVENDR